MLYLAPWRGLRSPRRCQMRCNCCQCLLGWRDARQSQVYSSRHQSGQSLEHRATYCVIVSYWGDGLFHCASSSMDPCPEKSWDASLWSSSERTCYGATLKWWTEPLPDCFVSRDSKHLLSAFYDHARHWWPISSLMPWGLPFSIAVGGFRFVSSFYSSFLASIDVNWSVGLLLRNCPALAAKLS